MYRWIAERVQNRSRREGQMVMYLPAEGALPSSRQRRTRQGTRRRAPLQARPHAKREARDGQPAT